MLDIYFASPIWVFARGSLIKSCATFGTFIFWVIARDRTSTKDDFALLLKFFEAFGKIRHAVYDASHFI